MYDLLSEDTMSIISNSYQSVLIMQMFLLAYAHSFIKIILTSITSDTYCHCRATLFLSWFPLIEFNLSVYSDDEQTLFLNNNTAPRGELQSSTIGSRTTLARYLTLTKVSKKWFPLVDAYKKLRTTEVALGGELCV